MNKNTLIILGVVALLIIALAVYLSANQKTSAVVVEEDTMVADEYMTSEDEVVIEDAMIADESDSMVADDAMSEEMDAMEAEGDSMMQVGSYEAYTSEKASMASDNHDVVLFFNATWCPTCRTVDTDIKANLSKIPAGLTILNVDYDNSTDLKKKYGVTYQHTFVQVDADGNLIKKWSGGSTLTDVVAQVK